MHPADPKRLIAATLGFQCLRGLLYAPMGMVNVGFAVVFRIWPPMLDASPAGEQAMLVLMLCGCAATAKAWWYYRRRFGVVRARYPGNLSVVLFMVAVIVLAVAFVGAVKMDGGISARTATPYSVSFMCLSWALLYLGFYVAPFGLRPHSLWFAALFLGLAFLTATGDVHKSQFFMGTGNAGVIVIWLAFSVHGMLDHLALLRLLPGASAERATSPLGERHE